MGKYFGTDGFRGKAGEVLTAEHAFRTGRFLGWYYGEPSCERHGPHRHRQGYPPLLLHVRERAGRGHHRPPARTPICCMLQPPPASAYITRTENFDCGVMISASHNPYYDNGIKLMNGVGEKMDDALQARARSLSSTANPDSIPWAVRGQDRPAPSTFTPAATATSAISSSIATRSFGDRKVALDCSNGSAWMIGRAVFDALGAKTYVINDKPDGVNVNLRLRLDPH